MLNSVAELSMAGNRICHVRNSSLRLRLIPACCFPTWPAIEGAEKDINLIISIYSNFKGTPKYCNLRYGTRTFADNQ